jgi:hypothetical protein
MNTYEEELQKNLEAGKNPEGDELDIKSYEQVFHALRREPEYKLPFTFADTVVQRAMRNQKAKGFLNEYFWFGFGIALLLIALGVAISQTEFTLSAGFLSGMSAYKGLLFFGVVFILLLNWIDKRLVRNRQSFS